MKIIVNYQRLIKFVSQWLSLINRRLAIVGCCIMAIVLSGCVKYDTGINFSSLNSGEIVEHIQVSEQLNSFSHNSVGAWLATIEQRTKQAQGRIERISDREFKITIPFNNVRDLANRINLYFASAIGSNPAKPKFSGHLSIEQNNFLVVVRNHLIYEIDLRSLIVKSEQQTAQVPSKNLVDLNFSLQSPWGVSSRNGENNIVGIKVSNSNQINWKLPPGQIDRIEAVFWLPNELGIGTIAIGIISLIGYYLKYRQLPGTSN